MGEPGKLQVVVERDDAWNFFELPYTVRDAHLAVVHEGRVGGGPIELRDGLYSVAVITHAGAPFTSVVSVEPNTTTRIRIAADGGVSASTLTASGASLGENTARPTTYAGSAFTTGAAEGISLSYAGPDDTYVRDSDTVVDDRANFEVESTRLCDVVQFDADEQICEIRSKERVFDRLPTAVFQLGRRRFEMSLPLNPLNDKQHLPASRCFVRPTRDGDREHLRASFPPERDLCVTIEGLLQHRTASSAVDMLSYGGTLLFQKYSDPTGAALGGLTLHGMGRVDEREGWIFNLARSFPWLPDGQILCAALKMHDPDAASRDEGLSMLLSATQHRPLYTDGLSLAMELLRRWPKGKPKTRNQRLEWMADLWARADWDSIILSTEL
jgi:hypothetical protein